MTSAAAEARVDFEVPLEFPYGTAPSGGGRRSTTTLIEPGLITWNGARIRQFYDNSPRVLPGILKVNGTCTPLDIPNTLFDIGTDDVAEMSWDEVTGEVRITTNEAKSRKLRPFHFSDRADSVAGAVALADACYPSSMRERSDAQPTGIGLYLVSLVPLILLPLVFLVAMLAVGAPVPLTVIAGVLTALAVLLAALGVRSRRRLRDEQAEMIASGMGAVTIRPGHA